LEGIGGITSAGSGPATRTTAQFAILFSTPAIIWAKQHRLLAVASAVMHKDDVAAAMSLAAQAEDGEDIATI